MAHVSQGKVNTPITGEDGVHKSQGVKRLRPYYRCTIFFFVQSSTLWNPAAPRSRFSPIVPSVLHILYAAGASAKHLRPRRRSCGWAPRLHDGSNPDYNVPRPISDKRAQTPDRSEYSVHEGTITTCPESCASRNSDRRHVHEARRSPRADQCDRKDSSDARAVPFAPLPSAACALRTIPPGTTCT